METRRSGFHRPIQGPPRSSSHSAGLYPWGSWKTDRKRDFYILTQIGKQFVSSFEIHRAAKWCACVRQYRDLLRLRVGTSAVSREGAKIYSFPNRGKFPEKRPGRHFPRIKRIICLMKYSMKRIYLDKLVVRNCLQLC